MTSNSYKVNSNILEQIAATFKSNNPNLLALNHTLAYELRLSPKDIEYIVYLVVRGINERLFPPITNMELMLTEACNLSCEYCFESAILRSQRQRKRIMSSHIIEAAINLFLDYSRGSKALEMVLFGGEPTLNWNGIRKAVDCVERKVVKRGQTVVFNITTNGLSLTADMVEYFSEHNVKVLLSIDGLEQTHDRYRVDKSGNGTFTSVMKKMLLLKRKQPWIGIKMTVMPTTVANLFENVTGLYDMGINQFLIGHATGVSWSKKDVAIFKTQLENVYCWYKAVDRKDLRITMFEKNDRHMKVYGCQAAQNTISVACDGQIAGCSKILSLDDNQIVGKLGDVKFGLYNLLNRTELVNCIRLRDNCEKLGLRDEYINGCFAVNYEDNQDLYQPSLLEHDFSLMINQICNKLKLDG